MGIVFENLLWGVFIPFKWYQMLINLHSSVSCFQMMFLVLKFSEMFQTKPNQSVLFLFPSLSNNY